MGGAVRFEPFLGVHLVGANHRAYFVVEDLRRGAGEGGQPGLLGEDQVVAQRHTEPARTFGDLERGEAVHVDVGGDCLRGACDVEVVAAVEVGMDPALEADLGGAVLDGFDDASLQLVEPEQVGIAAEVQRERALRERTELALEGADVRVVDVAVAHEGDGVTDRLGAQAVGDVRDASEVGAPCAEQGDDLLDVDFFAGEHTVEHLADCGARTRGPSRGECRGHQLRRCHVAARAPVVVAREAFGVGCALHCELHVGMQPPGRIAHVLGIHGEARRQCLADGFGGVSQRIECGPRPLGVDVIRSDGRDPAPVVDPGTDERAEIGRQVGRCLQVDLRRQDHARHGDGPEEFVGVAGVAAPHRGARLGQEVLHDHFLHVPVPGV